MSQRLVPMKMKAWDRRGPHAAQGESKRLFPIHLRGLPRRAHPMTPRMTAKEGLRQDRRRRALEHMPER